MKGFGIIVPMKEIGWFDKEKPVAGEYDAILRPVVIAPCTSDVHSAYDIPGIPHRILGHEVVGEIVEIGSQVKDFKVGDIVAVPAVTPDWRALNIQDGLHQHSNGMFGGMRLSTSIDGAWGEYFLVNDVDLNVAKVPEWMSMETAVMLGDMVTTGFHGTELADIKFGDTVCVIGIGPVGLMSVASAAIRGASRIIAVGTRANCIKIAKEYGATDIISYRDGSIDQQVLNLTDGNGVDAVIVAGGESEAITQGINMVIPGGTVANLNVQVDPNGMIIPMAGSGLGCGHKKFVGGLCPGGRRRLERLIDLVKYNRIDPSKLVTHTLQGFDKIEDSFKLMVEKPKDLIKPIVYID